MTLAVECCHTILESDLAAWGFFLRKVLPWEKRVKLFLEALSQGQCIPRPDKDLSRTTGDRAPRLAPFALKSLTCGFGTLEVWWMLAQEGWTVWSNSERQDVEDRGQDRPRLGPAPRVPGMDCSCSLDLLLLLYGGCQGLEVPLL